MLLMGQLNIQPVLIYRHSIIHFISGMYASFSVNLLVSIYFSLYEVCLNVY